MKVSVSQTTLLAAAGAIALSVIGLVYAIQFSPADTGGLAEYAPRGIVRIFDLDAEGNIPAWFESALLLAGAFMSFLMGAVQAGRVRSSWRVLTAGLLLMSCDEVAGLHEFLGRFLSARLDSGYLDVYFWVVPGTIAAATIALFARRAVASLDPPARRRVILAAILFFTGALGLEVVESIFDARLYGTSRFSLLAWAEESLELAGCVLYLHALMAQLRDRAAPVGLTFVR